MRFVLLIKITVLGFGLPFARLRVMALLTTKLAHLGLRVLIKHVLSQHPEVGLMSRKTQHDEIGIKSVYNKPGIGIIVWRGPLSADEGHDLVFSFPGDTGIGYDHLAPSPRGIRIELV